MANLFNTANRIPCDVQGCNADFARQADMQRHVTEYHGEHWLCTEPNCPWPGAKRKSRLDAHRKKEHGNIHQGKFVLNNIQTMADASSRAISLKGELFPGIAKLGSIQ